MIKYVGIKGLILKKTKQNKPNQKKTSMTGKCILILKTEKPFLHHFCLFAVFIYFI